MWEVLTRMVVILVLFYVIFNILCLLVGLAILAEEAWRSRRRDRP